VCLVTSLDDQSCEGNDVEHLSLASLGDLSDVPTTKERLDGLEDKVRKLEGGRNPESRAVRQKTWRDRLLGWWIWIINHKGTTVILAIVMPVLVLAIGYYLTNKDAAFNKAVDYRMENSPRLAGMDKNVQDLNSNMAKVQATLATLQPFIQDLVRHEMEGHAALTPQKFELALPQLAANARVAKQEKIIIPSDTIATLQQKLLETNQNVPDYWAAASALINYHSSTVVGSFGDLTSLPACTGIYAQQMPATPGRNPKRDGGIISQSMWFVQKDCYWVLDENTPISNMLFIHCLIIYEGGPLSLRDVAFQNCLFDLRVQETPSPGGQHFGRELLASNLQKVQINSP